MRHSVELIEIVELSSQDTAKTKELIHKYFAWIDIDLSFQNIADELAHFPRLYEAPEGAFWLAKDGDEVIGCGGFRKISETICEMKRLYVLETYQGRGLVRALIEILLQEAKAKGYQLMRLDTLSKMIEAQQLYQRFGFYEIDAYTLNPLEGTLFMEKRL
ncbi:MAG: GNAT family N-acetyltransferase [Deinococcales bacterium]